MTLYIPLDVEYASDDEFIEAGPMAELLFIRAACFIKRKKLDGVIKKSQLSLFSNGIPQPKRAVRALIEVGLWEDHGETWAVPSYLKHNPSRKEIETKRELAKESGEQGAHERWHVQEKRPSPKCRFCIAERIATPTDPPNGVGWPRTEPVPEPVPVPEPKPYTGTRTSSSNLVAADDDERFTNIIKTIVDHRIEQNPARGNPTNYRQTIERSVRADQTERIHELAAMCKPDTPISLLAGAVESGDTRNLAMWLNTPVTPPDAGPALSREERDAIVRQAKESKP